MRDTLFLFVIFAVVLLFLGAQIATFVNLFSGKAQGVTVMHMKVVETQQSQVEKNCGCLPEIIQGGKRTSPECKCK